MRSLGRGLAQGRDPSLRAAATDRSGDVDVVGQACTAEPQSGWEHNDCCDLSGTMDDWKMAAPGAVPGPSPALHGAADATSRTPPRHLNGSSDSECDRLTKSRADCFVSEPSGILCLRREPCLGSGGAPLRTAYRSPDAELPVPLPTRQPGDTSNRIRPPTTRRRRRRSAGRPCGRLRRPSAVLPGRDR